MKRPRLLGHSALVLSMWAVAQPATAQVLQPNEDEEAAILREGEVALPGIIVTAQKRDESLQDVPIAITVVGGEELVQSGASQLVDFGGYVPGLQVDSTGTPGQTTLSLRGVAPVGPSQTVGIYLDESPVGSSSIYARSVSFALDLLPYDIQQIEVLRGPQGTLYGASSIGGLLKYVTVRPDLDAVTGRFGFEGFDIAHGGDLGVASRALISAPLIPGKLAVSLSGAYRRQPGYVDNVQTGQRDQNDYRQYGGRASLLFQPTDPLTIQLSAIYQNIKSDNNAQIVEDLDTERRIGDGLSNNNFFDEPFSKDFQYYSGTIDYDVGFATITSASSYSTSDTVQLQDGSRTFGVLFPLLTGGAIGPGLSPFTLSLSLKKFTQELRLTSPSDDRFEWLVGAFYTNEKSNNQQLVNSQFLDGTPIPGLDPLAIAALPSKFDEYAGFANATFKFNRTFHLTGGLRYARNEQSFRQISTGAIIPTADDPGQSDEGVFTYSVSPQIHVNDDTMLYGRVASGYRPGGPNVTLPNVPPIVGSDRLTSYEVGLKSNLRSIGVTLDLAAYYLDWQDIQLGVSAGGVSFLSNAGAAKIKGVEGSVLWQPVAGLRLGANGSYVDAELDGDPPPSTGGADGDRLPNVPKFSGALTADYSFPLGKDEARIGAGLRHTGRRISLVESNPLAVPADAYTAVDLNAEVTFEERFTLRAYARNLFDSDGAITRSLSTDGLNRPNQFSVTPLQPRTVGLAVDYAF